MSLLRGFVGFAITLLVPALLECDSPKPSKEKPPISLMDKPRAKSPNGSINGGPPYVEVRKRLAESRAEVAHCFWMDPATIQAQYRLIFNFSHDSKLTTFETRPRSSAQIKDCIEEIASRWILNPNPLSRPYVFETRVQL